MYTEELKDIISIIKQSNVEVEEACKVIQFYIYKRKGVFVPVVNAMNPKISKIRYIQACNTMMKMYNYACDFLLLLHSRPENCTVKIY